MRKSDNRLLLSALVGIALFLLFVTGSFADTEPPSAAVTADQLTVVSTEPVEQFGGDRTTMSPDGQVIALFRRDGRQWELIVRDRSGEMIAPAIRADVASVDFRAMSWSPDARRIVFTESFHLFQHEPDLWVADIDDHSISNLTDDGVTYGNWWHTDSEHSIDIFPVWRTNNRIDFIRISEVDDDGYTAHMNSIRLGDKEPESLFRIPYTQPMDIMNFFPVPGERGYLYTIYPLEEENTDGGIWWVDKSGNDTERILGHSGEYGCPVILSVSPTGEYLLGHYPELKETPSDRIFLMNIDDRSVQWLTVSIDGEDYVHSPADQAVFSPDGSKILYTASVFHGDLRAIMAVRDVSEETGTILFRSDGVPFDSIVRSRKLQWCEDDSIIAGRGEGARGLRIFKIGIDSSP